MDQISMDDIVDCSQYEPSDDELKDCHLVAFASFGNDSVALVQWLFENKFKNVTVVFNDTGHAASWWPRRVDQGAALCAKYGFKFDITTSVGMQKLIKHKKGFPPNGPMQFCTKELKLVPTWRWLQKNDPKGEFVCVNGVRRDESQNRKEAPRWRRHSANHQMRPLFSPLVEYRVSERDMLLDRAGFKVLKHKSMECYPCFPNANRSDILMLDDQTIAMIEKWEKAMGFTSSGKPRTAFRPARYKGAIGIRNVVRWAKHQPFEVDPDYIEGNDDPDDGCWTGFCHRG